MLDDPLKAERLMEGLAESVPIPVICPPVLIGTLKKRPGYDAIGARATIKAVRYMGDPGGIMCELEFGSEAEHPPAVVSISHLIFPARHPLAREVAGYQKHRAKQLRKRTRV